LKVNANGRQRTRAKIVKNKVAPPSRRRSSNHYGEGISKVGEIIDLG
jgi:RecA/RadA recombinase